MSVGRHVAAGGHVTYPWQCDNPGCTTSGSSIYEAESVGRDRRHQRECARRPRTGKR